MQLDVVELTALAELERRGAIAERGHVSAFTYSKLVLAEDLRDYDDVLYLDVDTLVRGPLDGLLAWPLRYEIGAIPELGTNGKHLFKSVRTPYFNAGVLRMSLGRMRESGRWARAQRILMRRPRLPFQDQDVLNLIYRDAFDILPATYNVFDLAAREAPSDLEVFHDPTVVHFVGPVKPWHQEAASSNARDWRRVNADALDLPADRRDAYVSGGRPDSRQRVSATIAAVRFSPVGRRVRSALPYEIKHAVNQTVLKIVPPRTRLADGVLAGIVARPRRGEIGPTVIDEPRVPTPSGVPAGESRARSDGVFDVLGAPTALPPSGRALGGSASDLLLVVSAPRSGTTAFGSLLSEGFPRTSWFGEVLRGAVPAAVRRKVYAEFPWLEHPEDESFAHRTDSNVVELTRRLVQLSDEAAIVKVQPTHLPPASLDAVFRELRPRVVVLRRTMLFSLVSLRRSVNTGVWIDGEVVDTRVTLTDSLVRTYVERTDAWFDWASGRIAEHGLDAIDVTYSDVYETRTALAGLRTFLGDWQISPVARDDDSWLPMTAIQDRRSDESVEQALAAFAGLSPQNQRDLLRLPGLAGSGHGASR